MPKGRRAPDTPVFLRLTADERTRFKVAAAQTGTTYAAFVMRAVERHERAVKARPVVAASPLHAGFEDDE